MNPSRPVEQFARSTDSQPEKGLGLDLAAISHELRTPLQAIMAFSQLAQQEQPSQVCSGFLEQIDQASRLMLRVVNDILDLSKLEQSGLQLQRETPFEVQRLMTQAFATAEALRQGGDVALYLELDEVSDLHLLGDARRIEQVLLNLLSNAIRSTDFGWVRLGAKRLLGTASHVVVRYYVADTGVGMAPEALNALLLEEGKSPKSYGDSTRGGSGYGVRVVRSLLALMGAKLKAASVPGGGSLMWFDLMLPIASEQALHLPADAVAGVVISQDRMFVGSVEAMWRVHSKPVIVEENEDVLRGATWHPWVIDAAHPEAQRYLNLARELGHAAFLTTARAPANGLRSLSAHRFCADAVRPDARAKRDLLGLRVLVVDDNRLNQEAVRAQLSNAGVAVSLAVSCEQARAMLKFKTVDVALIDLQLLDGSGLELARWMRAQPGLDKLPFALVSAHIDERSKELASSLGAIACLLKPYAPEDLTELLRRASAHIKWPTSGVARTQAGLQALSGVDLKDLFGREWPRLRQTLDRAQTPDAKRAAVHAIRGSLAVLGHSPELRRAKALEERLIAGDTPAAHEFEEFVLAVGKMLTFPASRPGS